MVKSRLFLKKINPAKATVRHNLPQEFIGIDVGSKRIGVARGSDLAKIAQPLKTLEAKNAVTKLADLAENAAGLVIGLPRGLDGQDTQQTKLVRQWVKQVKVYIKKPFYWQDEALTSVTAQAAGGLTAEVDALAASVILQDFLNTPQEDRVKA